MESEREREGAAGGAPAAASEGLARGCDVGGEAEGDPARPPPTALAARLPAGGSGTCSSSILAWACRHSKQQR